MKQIVCHDCGAKEGEVHAYGCDMERCPFCGWQLISCDCAYRMLGLEDRWTYGPETNYLPQEIYENGLTPKQAKQWLTFLKNKGRRPYIRWPLICARCGELYPEFFQIPDEEWERYIDPSERRKILCWSCYLEIKHLIDSGGNPENHT